MLSELLKKKSIFSLLYKIDKEIADQYKEKACPYCGGPLHWANYPRKPRGEPHGVSEECYIRFSLCCGREGCRRRTMPPSCRFLGRKIYWYIVILLRISDFQNQTENSTISEFSQNSGISRNTIGRWLFFFQEMFPKSPSWQSTRGLLPACIKNDGLPASMMNYLLCIKSDTQEAVISCLKLLTGVLFA